MILVVAEKPSVGRDIARVLGATQRGDGCLKGNGYIVTWAIGHLVTFAEPNDYHASWAGRWAFQQLPMIPENWMLKTIPNTLDQYKVVERLMADPQVTRLVCATDAGREGENIFRLIYEKTNCHKPFDRLWISSLTEEAIREGFAKLRPGEAFDDLAAAARARAQADWLVGMNMTRAYTVHHRALLTIGRVQTPTLSMIVARENLITKFKKAYYYELLARFQEGFWAKYQQEGKTKIEVKAEAERLYQKLKDLETATVKSYDKRLVRNRAPALYDLITLQKEANKRYGYTASRVLELAQELYETHKAITYPRTESRHISEDMEAELPGILAKLDHPQASAAFARLKAGFRLGKAYMDRTKLTDHHGIMPTGRRISEGLGEAQRRIFQLIQSRFVAIFLPDQIVEEATASIDLGGSLFIAKGSRIMDEGWTLAEKREKRGESKPGSAAKPTSNEEANEEHENDAREPRQVLPDLKAGQQLQLAKLELLEKETAPPKRFTDATLLTAMKQAGREIEDEALAEAMKESGLGTSATRAEMIEKLIRTGYICREKKTLMPTEKGMALISVVAEPLKSPELTASWETKLKEIENGQFSATAFYQSITEIIRVLIPQIQRSQVLQLAEQDARGPLAGRAAPGQQVGLDSRGRTSAPPMVLGDEAQQTAAREQPRKDQRAAAESKASSPAPAAKRAELGLCPSCRQGQIIEGHQAYGCTCYREGCRFLLPKQVEGKKLTSKQVQELLKKGKTKSLAGFQMGGQKKKGHLLLAEGNWQLVLEAEPVQKPAVKPEEAGAPGKRRELGFACPRCGLGRLIEGQKGYGCSRFREGCEFVVWKKLGTGSLTRTDLKILLEKGVSPVFDGFTSEDGASVRGRLRLSPGGLVTVERVPDADLSFPAKSGPCSNC